MTSSSEAPAAATPPNAEPKRLGKYEIQRKLGAGGMGTVYLAKDTQLKRLVALKVLPAEKAKNATLVRRFYAEAQAAAQLRNEHIVAVYENGEFEGHLFIAMEFVDGTDLHELIRKRGKIPIKRSLEIIKQVTEALQHASDHNIVHRDIKPSNLLIRNDGFVKITDLGLARSIDDTLETDITRAGTTVGTVDYMSPEQGRNSKAADIRSDIYSLGCTWYHMLTGQPPFPEGSMTNKLQAHAVKPPPDPKQLNPNVTEGMVAVVQRMMAKKPDDRYQSAAELMKDLARPSLTRAGVVDEVLSAISEEGDLEIKSSKPEKLNSVPGRLPPKKKSQAEEEQASRWDWDAVKPFVIAGGLLLAVIGLGIVVAGLGMNFDLGGGAIVKPEENLRPSGSADSTVVVSPTAEGPATQSSAAPVTSPEMVSSSSPDGADPAPSTATPTTGTNNGAPQTVNSPGSNSPSTAGNTSPTGNQPGGTSPSIAQNTPSFDAESIPAWSTSPGSRSTPGTGASSGNSGNPSPGTNSPTTPNVAPKTMPNQPKPNDTTTRPTARQMTVGGGVTGGNHFRDLAAALRAIPKEGAVIRLVSAGPFTLPEISLRQVSRVSLVADPGQRPVVLVRPAEGELTAGLRVAEAVLEVEGIQFVLDRSTFSGSDPVSLLTSQDGQLTVRNCSFTVWGEGRTPVYATQVASEFEPKGLLPALEPRVLLEQVVVRGDHVTGLAITRPNADVVVKECLLASGEQPAILLSGKLPEALASTLGSKPRRAVRFLQSTLFSRRAVFELSADDAPVPPATALFLQESVMATAGETAVAIQASAWPEKPAGAPGSRLFQLNWSAKETALVGFRRLADLGPQASLEVSSSEQWQTLWGKTFPANQFASAAWPAATTDLSMIPVQEFERQTLPAKEVVRADGTPAGCDVKLLLDPAATSRRWLSAVTAKPVIPASPFTAAAANVVKVDISKQQDLGVILQNAAWPAGTIVEVSGSGLKMMTAVKLVGKRWKIVGRPTDNAPLILTPKSLSPDLPALIVVEQGCLELENLRFQIPASKKSSLASLIAGHGSILRLENVSLLGVWSDPEVLASAVHWSGGPALSDGTRPYLACRDSFFTGGCSGLRIDLTASPAYLSNSLFVLRGDALDVRLGTVPSGEAPGSIVADHLTLSAHLAAIHVREAAAEGPRPAHRFYVEQCVFASPVLSKNDENTAAVLSLDQPATELPRVEWWGTANGVSPDVTAFLRSAAQSKPNPAETGLARWQSAWPAEQDQRLLTGAGGVHFSEFAAIKPGNIKPQQFALQPKSKAATWDEGGRPIGADVKHIDVLVAAKPATPDKKPATPKTTGPRQADF